MDRLHFVYSLIRWWTLGLFLPLVYCESCLHEYSSRNTCLSPAFNPVGYLPRSGIAGPDGISMFNSPPTTTTSTWWVRKNAAKVTGETPLFAKMVEAEPGRGQVVLTPLTCLFQPRVVQPGTLVTLLQHSLGRLKRVLSFPSAAE